MRGPCGQIAASTYLPMAGAAIDPSAASIARHARHNKGRDAPPHRGGINAQEQAASLLNRVHHLQGVVKRVKRVKQVKRVKRGED
ncbi:hypothetical protein [Botrimarina hoheduenensis]|uniref:Uncharacterized protein n=1 Tax=Botrimarina hoheduenensis TaxID=2528000 RepID=A0A5C5VXK5_9BACT|nr:hypothetical protein [Botrimarina hoheduenensis]TWT43170.1 hypothetical protein Pla111_21200 [Botrimarina hoheduenensis]